MDKDKMIHPSPVMGKSPKILKVFREIKKFAPKDAAVLISGETGTYKELVAKAIHYNSQRQKGPFVVMNLASVPSDLIKSELFGYSSAGSPGKIVGRIEEATGGTLFLDEISEMDMNLQKDFIGVLQARRDESAASKSFRPHVRMICATTKDIKKMVARRQFTEELYNVLNAAHIKIPPLRERREDVLFLADYFLEESMRKFETGHKEFSKDARDFLLKYNWPQNVRELESTIKRAAILSNGAVISRKDLLIEDVGSCSMAEFLEEKLKHYLKEMIKLENCNLYDTVLSEVEKALIEIVLKETEGNQLRAAKTLGINRNTLRTKIKEYKIRI